MRIIDTILSINNLWKWFTSEIMKCFLRINGAKIGVNTHVSISSRILGKKVFIGDDCNILARVKIKASEIVIGNSCTLSADCFISGSYKIEIGDKSYLGKKTRIDLSRDVYIGKDVGFGENSVIWTHGYFPPADEGYPVTYAGVRIEDGSWVSTNITIMPGITIGKKTIIGAGSIVTKNVPDEVIVAGNPAKFIKNVAEIKNTKTFIEILEVILDGYKKNELELKEKYDNFVVYKYSNVTILLSNSFNQLDNLSYEGQTIVLSKNISKEKMKTHNNTYWFDFEDKIRLRTKNKEALSLDFYLLGFGIRFLKEN
jgi:acetyltransferase-like isoleucine patch superfamily enzyme